MKVLKINVESGALACDEALAKVESEIEVLKLSGETKVLKVIHGYGSSGVGGKIKQELKTMLNMLVKQNKITYFTQNEKFTSSNPRYKEYTRLYPELILDKDLQNLNPGITLIFL